jgi:hypothetical protein
LAASREWKLFEVVLVVVAANELRPACTDAAGSVAALYPVVDQPPEVPRRAPSAGAALLVMVLSPQVTSDTAYTW